MSSSSSGGGAYEPIANISPGWKYVGFLRLGDNSASGNVWEYAVGADTSSNCTTGDFVWDPNSAGGIDSGWREVSLTVALGGSGSAGTLTLGPAIQYAQGGYSNIARVQLQASANGVIGDAMTQEISVDFTRADGSGETVNVPDNSAPEGHNTTGSGSAAQAIQINPSSDNFVKVVFHAQVRLKTLVTPLPPPDSLSVGIYVFVE